VQLAAYTDEVQTTKRTKRAISDVQGEVEGRATEVGSTSLLQKWAVVKNWRTRTSEELALIMKLLGFSDTEGL
jgi:hypothetical protein